jgi:hypothetical protein
MEQDNDVWQEQKPKRHKGKHDKPKPWDEDPNIDRWKIEKFDPSWNESGLVAESSFSTLFPVYIGPLKPQKCPFNFFSLFFFFCWDCIAVFLIGFSIALFRKVLAK